jgi:hypothetical protein
MPLLEYIPRGFTGTKKTIDRMRELAIRDARNWAFIRVVTRIVRGCPHKNRFCQASKFFHFIKRYVQFINDPITANGEGLELVQAPMQTLSRRGGDCDDMSTLMAAGLMVLGIPTRFVTIKADPRRPKDFSHVYTIAQVNGRWMGADASVSVSKIGWEPRQQGGRQEWKI